MKNAVRMNRARFFSLLLSLSYLFVNSSCDSINNALDGESTSVELQELWRVETESAASVYPPAYSDGIVYFTVGNREIHAYGAATGKLIWRNNMKSPSLEIGTSRIFVDENQVYVNLAFYLYCFDKRTGNLIYKLRDINGRGGA